MKKIVFGVIILAVGLGGGYWYLRDGYMGHGPGTQKNENSDGEGGGATSDEKHGKAKKAPKPVPVTVAPVTKRRILRQVRVVGSLYGQDEITITPKVEGRILKTLADVGDRVKPGDTLLVIDDTDFRLAVNEAQRSLELELSRLGLKSLPKGDVDVSQLPLVVRAGFLERNSQIRKDRINRLGTSSPEEREQAETDNRVAQANYRQALLEAQTSLASAQLRQAQLNTALQRLADTKVVVPDPETTIRDKKIVEYSVVQRLVTQGELLKNSPSTSMSAFKLVIDNPLKLQAAVPERHLSEIRLGQIVGLEVESYRNQVFQGKVTRINPSVDRTNRNFQIEVEVPNADRRLRSGSFAKATIQTEADDNALTVPEEAVLSFAGVVKVFAVRDDKAIEVPVSTGVRVMGGEKGRESAWIEVRGELLPNDMVVTSGQTQLSRGRAVRIRKPDSETEMKKSDVKAEDRKQKTEMAKPEASK